MPTLTLPASRPSSTPAGSRRAPAPAPPRHDGSLADYIQSFVLDLHALRGLDVLDVAAGMSSFTAEACARRIDAVAVDPLYKEDPGEIGIRIAHAFDGRPTAPRPASDRDKIQSDSSGTLSLAPTRDDPPSAAQRFLHDYAAHRLRGRYVAGALPRLPFFDQTFDLVLCTQPILDARPAHGLEWQLAACRELVRVSAGEVRVHPASRSDGKLLPGLARLRRELRLHGIASGILRAGAGLPPARGSTLMLRRAAI